MTNREFYKEQILDVVCDGWSSFALDKRTNKVIPCDSCNCDFCAFDNEEYKCREITKKWANSEYIIKAKITENEKRLLELVNPEFKYIARQDNGMLTAYMYRPEKDSYQGFWRGDEGTFKRFSINQILFVDVKFDMTQWEDREPWLIDDLKKLEIRKEDGENDN